MNLDEVKSIYPALLRKYLFEGKEEEALYEAYKLGKNCFEAKIGIEDIMSLHTQCLEDLLKTLPPSRVHDIVMKSSNLLIEFSVRFGLVCQNYFEILQQTDERIRNAFYQAGEALTAGMDIQKMLSVILNIVKNLMEATGCVIMLMEEDRTVIKASEGLDAENEFFKDFLLEVIKEGKSKFVYDLREKKSPMILEDGREIRSVLALPLSLKGKTQGVLGICLASPHHYEEIEINLLTSFAYQAAAAIDNARLFSELQRHDETLETLYAIDRVVSQTLDMEEIFKSALAKAMESIDADSGSIHLLDETGENLILKTYSGLLSQEFISTISKLKMGEGVTGRSAEMEKPETADISHYPSIHLLPYLEKEGLVSLASTPLIAKGKVLGAITFSNHKYRIFSQDDLDLLASIGSQIGVAIQNATLFSELEKHHKMLQALYSIESVVSRSLNLEEIFNVALSKALEVTDTEAGTLYSLDGDVLHLEAGEVLRLEAIKGLSPEFKEKALIRKMGEGIPGIAAQSKKPITMDISQFPSPLLLPYVTKEGLVSFIGTPLMSKGKVVGALALGTKKRRIFIKDDLDLLFSIGNAIGIAVENARLYKDVKDKAEYISALYGIARAVKASLDVGEVFDAMVGEMRNILSFDRTSICLLREEMVEVFALAGEIIIPELGRGTRIQRKKSSSGFIMDRRAGLIRSLEGTPFYEDKFLFKKGIKSVIQVPLISKGEMIGVFNIESCTPDAYTQRDLGLAQAIADQIATSIENVRLYEDLKQVNIELEKRLKELEEFHTLAVGRELRMMELKERIRREEGK
jgi:GAF domain-containing protein